MDLHMSPIFPVKMVVGWPVTFERVVVSFEPSKRCCGMLVLRKPKAIWFNSYLFPVEKLLYYHDEAPRGGALTHDRAARDRLTAVARPKHFLGWVRFRLG